MPAPLSEFAPVAPSPFRRLCLGKLRARVFSMCVHVHSEETRNSLRTDPPIFYSISVFVEKEIQFNFSTVYMKFMFSRVAGLDLNMHREAE